MSGTVWAIGLLLILLGVGLVFVMWATLVGAPWVPTARKTVRRMLLLADVQPGEVVYDLGCGDGRVLIQAARDFGARAVGIEIDPLRYLWTRLLVTVLGLREQVQVVWGNLFKQDLGPADVVTIYLTQSANEQLLGKLRRELRPGVRVVSRAYTFPGWPPALEDSEAGLYVYKVKDDPQKEPVYG